MTDFQKNWWRFIPYARKMNHLTFDQWKRLPWSSRLPYLHMYRDFTFSLYWNAPYYYIVQSKKRLPLYVHPVLMVSIYYWIPFKVITKVKRMFKRVETQSK